MISVLINAYACAPHKGSEPGMAWNWIINLANHCHLHVITEGEWQKEIEEALEQFPQGKNITFYYNPVPTKVRNMCWNQGDWRFYYYYKKWQKSSLEIARSILDREKIDLVHQLNMIGFREPGYLWKIKDKPFIWGPIGGMEKYPIQFTPPASKTRMFSILKNNISTAQIKHSTRVKNALFSCSSIIGATSAEIDAVKKHYELDAVLMPETGCFLKEDADNIIDVNSECFNIIWVGKFDERKQLNIALQTLTKIDKQFNIKLHVVGSGNANQVKHYNELATELNISERVTWHGTLPNTDVINLMKQSQLFLFTSVHDATSTVILEALSCNLPILCFNTCGFGSIVNNEIGEKIPLSDPEQSVSDFTKKIETLYSNRNLLEQKSQRCTAFKRSLAWEEKAKQLTKLYLQAIKN